MSKNIQPGAFYRLNTDLRIVEHGTDEWFPIWRTSASIGNLVVHSCSSSVACSCKIVRAGQLLRVVRCNQIWSSCSWCVVELGDREINVNARRLTELSPLELLAAVYEEPEQLHE